MARLHPRQADILEIAKNQGRVTVEGLAAHFEMTPQTIRKDLNEMCEQEVLQRYHGGAIYPTSVTNITYGSRRMMASAGKSRIAEVAAGLVPDNSSVILNIGTTTEQVAMELKGRSGLLAITNNLNVATILSDEPEIELVIAGGVVRNADGGIVGGTAINLIRQFKVDFAVIGTSAIDEDGCLLDYDYREVQVAKAIIEQARVTILVADSSKFSRRAPVQIGNLVDIDVFVTDLLPPENIRELCDSAGVTLKIADADGPGEAAYAGK